MNVGDLDDPRLRAQIGQDGCEQLEQDIDLLNAAGDAFDPSSFLQGRLSPMFFGSAINNFGLETFLDSFIQMMPPPGPRASSIGLVDPGRQEFTGFVFKVQANMNPAHRDRVAFVRICSGQFHRKTKVLHVRTDREVRLANPTQFIAKERTIVEEAYAGDVIGVYDPGFFQVGDTLTGGTKLEFEPIPSFAPEYFKRLVMVDPLRRKQLVRGTTQLAQEGTVQLYQPPDIRTGDMILGAVGLLQLEVVKHRLASEYGVDVRLESVPFHLARWVTRTDGQPVDLSHVRQQIDAMLVVDVRDRPVVLFEAEWNLNSAVKFHPEYQFAETAQGVIVRDPQND
jgi:peptide chain release factor 3